MMNKCVLGAIRIEYNNIRMNHRYFMSHISKHRREACSFLSSSSGFLFSKWESAKTITMVVTLIHRETGTNPNGTQICHCNQLFKIDTQIVKRFISRGNFISDIKEINTKNIYAQIMLSSG